MKLSTLKGKERPLAIEVPEETEKVNIVYRPGELTLEVSDAIQDAIEAGRADHVGLIFLQRILVDWDLEEDVLTQDGEPTGQTRKLGVTPEDIKKVPIPFLGLLMAAVADDARPNPQTPESSDDSSLQVGSLVPSPNGMASSPQPNITESLPGNSLTSP